MGVLAGDRVAVSVDGLDGTTSRAVVAFVEAQLSDRFQMSSGRDAAILLVDVDQPAIDDVLADSQEEQVVVGVGFDTEPAVAGCRRYLQKPLTGAVVTDGLVDAASLIRAGAASPTKPGRPRERFSHARDVFKDAPRVQPVRRRAKTASDWAAPQRPRLDRRIHERASVLAAEVNEPGSVNSAAETLGQDHRTEAVPAHDGGDLADPAVLASHQYSPAHHLDGWILRAERELQGRRWELRGPALTVIGDPAEPVIWVNVPDLTLRRICMDPAESGWELSTTRRKEKPVGARPLPRDVAVWNFTVWASQGRLPDTLDLDSPATLKAWPDLTRRSLTPSVLPIIAALSARSAYPLDLPAELGVSRGHVFVVLAALHHVGVLADDAGATRLVAVPADPHPEQGILKRLLGRLRAA